MAAFGTGRGRQSQGGGARYPARGGGLFGLQGQEGAQSLSEVEAEVGPALLDQKPPLLKDYAAFRLRVARKALSGAENGSDAENAAVLRREIEIWEDVDKCL